MLNQIITMSNDMNAKAMYEDIIIENIQMAGTDWYYLPRTMVEEDTLLREDVHSVFNQSFMIEGILTNLDEFRRSIAMREKQGFFLDVKGNVVISQKRFKEVTSNQFIRPYEGDLMYSPLYKIVFEIKKVIHDKPLYELEQSVTYELLIDRWEYNHDTLDTGIEDVDNIQYKYGYQLVMSYGSLTGNIDIGDIVYQITGNVMISGKVASIDKVAKRISVCDITSNNEAYLKFSPSNVNKLMTDELNYVNITKVYDVDSSLSEQESEYVMPHDVLAQNQFVEKDKDNFYTPLTKKLW